MTDKTQLLPVTAIASLWTEMSARANQETDDEADDAHAVGFRDGFEIAVQKLDELTGGDGEYRFSTDPERNCPTPVEMIANIVERFRISHSLPGEVGMREAPDFEGLGDALGALSHKLRMSGFLVNDENHTAYERVVAEFQAVSSKKGARHG